ncbi:MAG: response regulator [Myxococcales bacterium]|jgi:CheY-like chemotaxis protein|nr:response regulator [Myxococcales bacterium]MBK7197898.1 response regulator [Myxococcales bacterium]MBP6846494.1 response regulator [Kofleriaceae bacterium]
MSKVILCADDSVTMQTVAEITFRATDFAYAGARSADEAIDKIKAQRPALVLADAVMPGKTGYDLCHALKSDPATADIPVVILCGNSAPFDGARGTQVGADGSLTKPWDTQVMLDKVVEILDKVAASGVAKAAGKSAGAAPTPVAPPPVAPPPVAVPPVAAAPAAVAAQPKVAPPRSATIMGMPTIKMPGPAPVAPAPAPVAAAPAPVAAAPVAAPRAASPTGPIATPAPAPVAAAPATVRGVGPVTAPAAPVAQFTTARAPMVSGIPTKRSALVERTLAKMGERLAELSGLTPGSAELTALVKLSTEVVERIVWEVVPELAEAIIREHVAELAAKRAN